MLDESGKPGEASAGGAHDPGAGVPADLNRVLLDVARSTASCRSLECLLHDLTGVLHRFAGFDRLAVVLHDADRNVMRLHSLASLHASSVTVHELPIEDSPAGIAWQTQEPVVLSNLERETRFP